MFVEFFSLVILLLIIFGIFKLFGINHSIKHFSKNISNENEEKNDELPDCLRQKILEELQKDKIFNHLDIWTKRNYGAALNTNTKTPLSWE